MTQSRDESQPNEPVVGCSSSRTEAEALDFFEGSPGPRTDTNPENRIAGVDNALRQEKLLAGPKIEYSRDSEQQGNLSVTNREVVGNVPVANQLGSKHPIILPRPNKQKPLNHAETPAKALNRLQLTFKTCPCPARGVILVQLAASVFKSLTRETGKCEHKSRNDTRVAIRTNSLRFRPDTNSSKEEVDWRQLEQRGYAVPGYTRTFGNLPFSSAVTTSAYPAHVQAQQMLNFSTPSFLILPLLDGLDNSPLSRATLDFIRLGRQRIAGGTPLAEVADEGPIDVTLFFRDRISTDPLNAST